MSKEKYGKDKIIDREQEDRAVLEFQKTGDINILEEVYQKRIPTLKSWAHKHYYPGLTFSVEDLFEDLTLVFMKAAEKYDKNRGNFNTCLFTFLLNRLKNIKSSKYAKKRISAEYEGPLNGMILSLDYNYASNSSNENSEITLRDMIPCTESPTWAKTSIDETLEILSKKDNSFKDFLKKIGDGHSLVSVLREYRTIKNKINISLKQAKNLEKKPCVKTISDLIKSEIDQDFKLLSHKIKNNQLIYEIELNRTKQTDAFIKSLREIRKNKDYYRKKIEGI